MPHAENLRNKTSYNGRTPDYLVELPDGAEPFTEHRGRPIRDGHYRRGNEFYVEVDGKFRRLTHSRNGRGWQVAVRGPNNEQITIYWRD